MSRCPHCSGYGYCQVYDAGRVKRVFCDCSAGTKRIAQVKEALSEVGLDPDNPDYDWSRRSYFV